MGSLCSVLSLQTFKPGAGYFLIPPQASLPRGWWQSLQCEGQVAPGEDIKGERAACETDGCGPGKCAKGHLANWLLVQGLLA